MAPNSTQTSAPVPHRWRFFRSGGFDQVRLETGADLLALDQLDQKLWAALSCPARGLEFDTKTLALIDSAGDGRIRVPEILAAVRWAGSVLKNPDDLTRGASRLPLSAINDATPEGAQLLASARQILTNLGKGDAEEITLDDTTDTEKIFAKTTFNGDGIIPAAAADDEETRRVIEDIIECLGSEIDRSGAPGISQDKVDQFFTEAQAYSEWWVQAEREADTILPFGEATAAAATIFEAVKAKVDDYFTRCRLAAFDSRAAELLNPAQTSYEALSAKDLSASTEELALLPLATIAAGKPLPLTTGINPAWTGAIAQFRSAIVTPLFGDQDTLSADEWETLSAKFAAYEAWMQSKEGIVVERLGLARVRDILAGDSQNVITTLIAKDKALEPESNAISAVDKLVRYHRDLFRLLNNFVSFRDFYVPGATAIFQAGRLYLDGRSCDLCIRVDDIAKHSSLAQLSRTYLAYCECTHNGSAERMTIAAAFTNGDEDNLLVGRNGVFYDRKGQDWDATIVKLIEHPISVRQAFWSPYKRASRMISEQIEKMAAAREKEVETRTGAGISGVAQRAEAGKTPAEQTFDIAKFAGIFAAIGLAIGAIGTALAAVVTGVLGLTWWQMPLALIGLLLAISGPAMVIAYLKLRQRNLAPLLDANGWAVNIQAKINIPFGASLTSLAQLPPGAQRSLQDPFAEKKRPWKLYFLLVVFIAAVAFLWQQGFLQQWWERFASHEATTVTEEPAPATPEEPTPPPDSGG
jgi:hypothetical protein